MNKREWAVLALALALLAVVALRPSIRGNDGVGYYVYLASLLRDGDLDFSNEYRAYDALKQYPFKFSELPRSPRTGRPSDRYGIGAACFWSPFVLAVHGTLRLAHSPQADAMSRPYEWAVGLGTVFWASLGLALLYGRLRRQLAPLACGAILAGLIFATPLGFYMYAHGSMSHGISFFIAVMLLLAFERAWAAPTSQRFAWCGFWSAWLMMCRFQDATWVVVLGAALAGRLLWMDGSWRKKSAHLGALSIAFFAVFALQMAVWKYLYGSWCSGPMPYLDKSAGAGYFEGWPVHFFQTLFSGRKGVLAWHPLYAIGLAGLAMMARPKKSQISNLRFQISDSAIHNPQSEHSALCTQQSAIPHSAFAPSLILGWVGLAGFFAQLLLVASWSMWWAGASFGNRFFISSLPFIALGLGRLAEALQTRRQRVAALLLLLVLIAWNMGLLLQYATEMLPREDWVSWRRIIRQNVIDVPEFLFRHLLHRH